jgi:hypothetical protein
MDWEKHDDLSTLFILCAEEGRTICKRDYSYTTYEQARKDFDLMAAAPDLYEALRAAMRIEVLWVPQPDATAENETELSALFDLRRDIIEALAKADGVKTETVKV